MKNIIYGRRNNRINQLTIFKAIFLQNVTISKWNNLYWWIVFGLHFILCPFISFYFISYSSISQWFQISFLFCSTTLWIRIYSYCAYWQHDKQNETKYLFNWMCEPLKCFLNWLHFGDIAQVLTLSDDVLIVRWCELIMGWYRPYKTLIYYQWPRAFEDVIDNSSSKRLYQFRDFALFWNFRRKKHYFVFAVAQDKYHLSSKTLNKLEWRK